MPKNRRHKRIILNSPISQRPGEYNFSTNDREFSYLENSLDYFNDEAATVTTTTTTIPAETMAEFQTFETDNDVNSADEYSSNSEKYDDKNNIIDDYFNDDTTDNYVLSSVNEYLESAVNGKMDINNFGNLEEFILNTDTNNQPSSGFHPFPDL
ncbi:hypothetical protein PHYBLDRAFT_144547 [Phycomyces blakesleeanus NRRL 1555(-)]|uniref:Uncharacterized protein n=1 Tax=Phycomyces blakesleeanus (strain ATCC 8743b / DSM 1359 / FGSC 10004 / NBRC 33097 / NRRL 1555) TaxID=763407 RepID=A0A167MV02_PHYB8|nr:hypothetical protein PHYBLDRAFT_144547 [Phycomyces blakesleeanus NRRL 1555(-)]OAD74089.1 hypothetical protein PHYBLDRAFT_144547 [Phycomyces blakesleeanus NRRL 1555(-)]|eukprot:XP_018292129.1 hypothetical protein PHYBLDRAFT_144547 [Phycomyces blakesleeanus NRRL 1555(-)]